MTVQRWPLLCIAAAAVMVPACLHIEATPYLTPDQAAKNAQSAEPRRKLLFAELPSRPGTVVYTNPAGRDSSAVRPADVEAQPEVITTAGSPDPAPVTVSPKSTNLEPPLVTAVKAYAENRPDRAIEQLAGLDKPNQEFVLALLPLLARGSTADLMSDPIGTAVMVEQLRTAAARLEPRAALRIDTVAFCKRVDGFARYVPWPKDEPYRPNDQAQLYVEVRNLVSQPAAGPRGETYLTHAQFSVEVRDAKLSVIPQPDPEDPRRRIRAVQSEKKLFSRGPLHDFHLLYGFPVPATPGVYTVVVEVRDPITHRSVKSEPVQFLVAGP
jgi:hypothetical protein